MPPKNPPTTKKPTKKPTKTTGKTTKPKTLKRAVSLERIKTREGTIQKMEMELRDREIQQQEKHINKLQELLDEKKNLYGV